MLTSKDILERTGISRATLNNYIGAGLIARPEVLQPRPEDGDAPRIGYFPDDAVERIETIQRLKREGWSLTRIAEHFAHRGDEPAGDRLPLLPPTTDQGPVPSPGAAWTAPASRVAPLPGPEPRIMVVAVVAVALHDADGLWVTLPVHDYFRLAEEVESEVHGAVRRHQGQAVRTGPSRFTCHFLPRPGDAHLWDALQCSVAVRDAVRELSAQWKLRRGWDLEIVMDAALCAGETWVARPGTGDLQLMGTAIERAQQLARWARAGCVVLTRDFVSRLPADRRDLLVYTAAAANGLVREATFSQFRDLSDAADLPPAIAQEPVAQFVQLRNASPGVWKDAE